MKPHLPPDYESGLPSCDDVQPAGYDEHGTGQLLPAADHKLSVAEIEARERARLLNPGQSKLGQWCEWAINAIRIK